MPPSEPMDPTGVILPGIIWPVWLSKSFQAAAALLPHEDVVADLTGKIFEFVM